MLTSYTFISCTESSTEKLARETEEIYILSDIRKLKIEQNILQIYIDAWREALENGDNNEAKKAAHNTEIQKKIYDLKEIELEERKAAYVKKYGKTTLF